MMERMKNTGRILAVGAVLSALFCGELAAAQEGDGSASDTLDLTMTLLPEGATTPEAVTRTIELPDAAALRAEPPGLDRADESRQRRGAGLETAAGAREQGREFGQQMAQQAQEGRENAGRGANGERPELPDRAPDSPGPPEGRGPPGN